MKPGRGYVEALLGAVAGAAVLAAPGFAVVFAPCEGGGLECLGNALAGVALIFAGAVVGQTAGAYVALRLRRQPGAGLTAAFALAMFVGLMALVSALDKAGAPARPTLAAFLAGPLLARVGALRWLARSKSDDPSDILGSPPAPDEETPWTSSTAPKRRPSRRRSGSS